MRVLLLNQAFYPDVVATAQHASDLVAALSAAGHEVTVVASRRAYDDPKKRFPAESRWEGARVVRVGGTGFGKRRAWHRAVDFATFMLSSAFRLLTLPASAVVIAMTSPPLISFVAALLARVRGGKLLCWIMDLNPDEAVAAGWLDGTSLMAAALERALKFSLETAESIVVLDCFMRERVLAKGVPARKIKILPPWSHDTMARYDESGRTAFRREHRLEKKFVVMYSGNHSPCHPLDTLLEAARRLSPDERIAFCFVGGGSEFEKVKSFAAEYSLGNILCLPYQPRERVAASLSSADLHIVSMGDRFVGIVHPCKIYNILGLGIPFLYIGPSSSHITELIAEHGIDGYAQSARHGDAEAVTHAILHAMGQQPRRSAAGSQISSRFSQSALLPRFTEAVQRLRPCDTKPGSRNQPPNPL